MYAGLVDKCLAEAFPGKHCIKLFKIPNLKIYIYIMK